LNIVAVTQKIAKEEGIKRDVVVKHLNRGKGGGEGGEMWTSLPPPPSCPTGYCSNCK
jgi:hypothetical protein